MSRLRFKIGFLATGLSLILCGCLHKDKPFTIQHRANLNFEIRVSGFLEKRVFGGALGGANYIFEARQGPDEKWREFLTLKYDDPIPVDENSIVLVNENLGYVFMIRNYAVTNTAGLKWSEWDVGKVPELKADLSCRIHRVNVMPDGNGSMEVRCNQSSKLLSTRDFGAGWAVSQ